MTHLRQLMLEELRRRNYAESTIHAYLRAVEHFAGYFHRSPDRLGLEHIRQYQAAMFTQWKLAPNTVTQRLAALRFLYIQVLKRGWSAAETPYPKKALHLPPHVLSQEEIARLIDAAEMPYATGPQLGITKAGNIDLRTLLVKCANPMCWVRMGEIPPYDSGVRTWPRAEASSPAIGPSPSSLASWRYCFTASGSHRSHTSRSME